jgi:hypothetical protein
MVELKTAQYLIKTHNPSVACGFNMFIHGDKAPTFNGEYYDAGPRSVGYDIAREMAEENGIAFKHNFGCSCGHYSFMYGGFFVCNGCGKKGCDEKWWEIQVEKDGDQFCCHGLDFENLQESDNYEFGETFNQAIKNYGEKMKDLTNNQIETSTPPAR